MFDAGSIAIIAPFLFAFGMVWLFNHKKVEEKRIAAAAERDRTENGSQNSARFEELEDRVRVLERIVTDGGYDLAHKIEALRDERADARIETTAKAERLG